MIQMYVSKKNFDVQKAERFFKERRVQIQVMDLKKHRLGERELTAIARGHLTDLIDRDDPKVKEHPACYYDRDSLLFPAVLECPWLLKSPILRNGSQITVGNRPEIWAGWIG